MEKEKAIEEKGKLASDERFNLLINNQSIEGYWSQQEVIFTFLDQP